MTGLARCTETPRAARQTQDPLGEFQGMNREPVGKPQGRKGFVAPEVVLLDVPGVEEFRAVTEGFVEQLVVFRQPADAGGAVRHAQQAGILQVAIDAAVLDQGSDRAESRKLLVEQRLGAVHTPTPAPVPQRNPARCRDGCCRPLRPLQPQPGTFASRTTTSAPWFLER